MFKTIKKNNKRIFSFFIALFILFGSIGTSFAASSPTGDDVNEENPGDFLDYFTVEFVSGGTIKNGKYVWDVGNKYYDGHKFIYRASYSMSGEYDVAPGEFEIFFPLNMLKNRYDEYANGIDIAVMEKNEYDGTHSDVKFLYEIVGDQVRVYNNKTIDAADSGFIEIGYTTSEQTYHYVDNVVSDNMWSEINIKNENNETEQSRDTCAPFSINTRAEISYVEKQTPTLYKTWQKKWGLERPSDANNYYYLMWPIKTVLKYNSQPYNFKLVDEIEDPNASVVSYRFSGEGFYDSGEISCLLGSNYFVRLDYVLTKHPKETFESVRKYETENKITATVIPFDEQDQISNATSNKDYWYEAFRWTGGPGNIYADKYGLWGPGKTKNTKTIVESSEDVSTYTLGNIYQNEPVSNIWFYSYISAIPNSWSVAEGLDPNDPDNFGTSNMKYVVEDSDIYYQTTGEMFDNGEENKLSKEDYDFKTLFVDASMYNGVLNEVEQKLYDIKEDPVLNDIYVNVFAKKGEDTEYEQIATLNIKTKEFSNINSDYVEAADGQTKRLDLKQGVFAYKIECENSYHKSTLRAYPEVRLYPTPRVIALTNNEYKVRLSNISEGRAYTADGTLKYRRRNNIRRGTDYLVRVDKTSEITNSVTGYDNNKDKKEVTVNWMAQIKEYTQTDDSVEYIKQSRGTFWILLPIGAAVNPDNVKVKKDEEEKYIAPGQYSVDLVDNYQDTGRTLMKVDIDVSANTYFVYYDTLHSWESIADYGQYVFDSVAYKTGNDEIALGYPDTGGTIKDKKTLYNLDGLNDAKNFIYAETGYDLSVVTSASLGLTKAVKSSTETQYTKQSIVKQGQTYSYKLRIANDSQTMSKDLVFYDSLENFVHENNTSDWHGTLNNIDISGLVSKDIDVKIYYSTVENLNIEGNTSLDAEIDNQKVWKTKEEIGDISLAKAIAIDCSKKKDGSDFVLDKGQSAVAVVYMTAPMTVTSLAQTPKTYNNIYLNNTVFGDYGAVSTSLIHYDFTEVTYRAINDIKIRKVNKNDHEETIEGISFRLQGISLYGTVVDKTLTTNSKGEVVFKNIERGTYQLKEENTSDDFLLNTEILTVEIDQNSNVVTDLSRDGEYFLFENTPRIHGDLEITKKNSLTNTTIQGAVFVLTGQSDYGNETHIEKTSNQYGLLSFTNIEKGTYQLIEKTVPNRFINDNLKYTVTIDDSGFATISNLEKTQDGEYIIYNRPYTSLTLWKLDEKNTNHYLQGAEFSLIGITSKGKSVSATATSDSNGMVYFDNLEPGVYSLEETVAPENFVKSDKKYTVYVSQSNDITIGGLEKNTSLDLWPITNERALNGQIKITKVWTDNLTNEERETPKIHLSTQEQKDPHPIARISSSLIWTGVSDKNAIKHIKPAPAQTKEQVIARGGYKVDDNATQSSVYCYLEGDTFYWWTDAAIPYIGPGNGMMANLKECLDIDLSGIYLRGTTNLAQFFINDSKVKTITLGEHWDMSKVETANGLFDNCVALESIDNLAEWDMSSIEDATYMFHECRMLDPTDVKYWNMPKLKKAYMMFTSVGIDRENTFDLDTSNWGSSQYNDSISEFVMLSKVRNLDMSGFAGGKLTNMARTFDRIKYCESITGLDLLDTSLVTSFENTFREFPLETLDLSGFDTGSASSFFGMFASCDNLKTLIGNENFDLSSASTTRQMFYHCISLEDLDVKNWGVSSNAVNITEMFYYCKKLKTIDADEWNVTNVVEAQSFCRHCESLESIDVSTWDMPKLKNAHWMFAYCTVLPEIDTTLLLNNNTQIQNMNGLFADDYCLTTLGDISGWQTSTATNMAVLFCSCSQLPALDLTNWDTSKCTAMSEMFRNCSVLTAVGDLSNWDTSKVTTFERMFEGCLILSEVDVSNFNTSSAIKLGYMFEDCRELEVIDVSSWDVRNVTSIAEMFWNCRKVKVLDVSGWQTDSLMYCHSVFRECWEIESMDLRGWNTSHVTGNTQAMFMGCKKMTTCHVENFNVTNSTNISYFFSTCLALKSLDLSNWDVSNQKNFAYMFNNCKALTSLNISTWKTSNAESMSYMFYSCEKLTTLDVTGFDTSSVTDMSYMFGFLSNTEYRDNVPGQYFSLDISNFDTSNVTNMDHMFYYLHHYDTIYVSDRFVTTNVTNGNKMFAYCFHIEGQNGTIYSESNVGLDYARVDGQGGAGYFTYKAYTQPNRLNSLNTLNSVVPKNSFMGRAIAQITKMTEQKTIENDTTIETVEQEETINIEEPTDTVVDSEKPSDSSIVLSQQQDLFATFNSLRKSSEPVRGGDDIDVRYDSDDSLWKKDGNVWSYVFDVFDDNAEYFFYEDYMDNYDSTGYWDLNVKINGSVSKEFSFTNTSKNYVEPVPDPTGGIEIAKSVSGDVPRSDGKYIGDFNFTVTLTGDQQYIEGEKVYGGVLFTDGVAKLVVRDGRPLVIRDIPVGLSYSVQENEENNGTWLTTKSNTTGTIGADVIESVRFVNTKVNKETNSFTLTKQTVNGYNGDTFDFDVVLTNLEPNMTYLTSTNMSFDSDGDGEAIVSTTLRNGQRIEFLDLPIGTKYYIEEGASNYTASYFIEDRHDLGMIKQTSNANENSNESLKTNTETVDSGENIYVNFVNTKPQNNIEQYVIINKVWENDTENDRPDNITFELYKNNRLSDSAITNATNMWGATFKIETPQDEFNYNDTYSVKEIPVSGYTTTFSSTGTRYLSYWTFTNRKIDTGSIKINKTVVGDDIDTNKEFVFDIYIKNANDEEVSGLYPLMLNGNETTALFVNGKTRISLKHNETATISQLQYGWSYSVQEVEDITYITNPINGYSGTINRSLIECSFTNESNQYSDLTIRKISDDNISEFDFSIFFDDYSEDTSRTFAIDGYVDTNISFYNGEARIKLRGSDEVAIRHIPVGVSYRIVEDSYPNYICLTEHAEGLIQLDSSQNVALIKNLKKGDAPFTGGLGYFVFIIPSVMIIGFAVLLIIRKKKK